MVVNTVWMRVAEAVLLSVAVISFAACSLQPRYALPNNLRLAIEGRPIVDGSEETVLQLDASAPLPVVRLKLGGPFGGAAQACALIDTGALLYLDLPSSLAERVRPWVWRDSVGRVRTWSFGEGAASLGVLSHVDLGNARLSHVPVIVSPQNRRFTTLILGIQAMTLFESVEFDWDRSQLTLRRASLAPPQSCRPLSPTPDRVSIRWWHPMGGAVGRDRGYITIPAVVAGLDTQVLLDTGCGGDLLVPQSVVTQEPWASCLEDGGFINVYGANNTVLTKRMMFRGEFRLGGHAFTNLVVAVFDDSVLPPGASPIAVVGVPLLRRFQNVVFDFANETVIFARDEGAEGID